MVYHAISVADKQEGEGENICIRARTRCISRGMVPITGSG
jgi:hypothetical protein